ncbi:hypothetical protein BN2475_590034 [Paraburkholderia ribeironis]|uniref:Uncharacterized protein n=1 Tax=Paraburkholderia ribeironis TaxID=1247936 RepID=A0A1N7SEG4_9BURK|nr:hypothetical protein BN2475_590034 [Paraburkholderia ribeironis]
MDAWFFQRREALAGGSAELAHVGGNSAAMQGRVAYGLTYLQIADGKSRCGGNGFKGNGEHVDYSGYR